MKNVIIAEQARENKKQSEDIIDTTAPAKVGQVLSIIDLVGRYKWIMSYTDLDAAKELGLTGI